MDKLKLTKIEGWLSIFVNIALFILKFWAGVATGSIAIIADAWHTLSDSLSSVVVLLGAKFSSKPPDSKHPFGHGRIEIITAMVIGVMLGLIAFSFIKESYLRLSDHTATDYTTLAIVATIISIVGKEALAQYAFWAARKVDSNVLRADGWHHRSDAISSVVILIGIFFGKYAWWIDSVLGFIVSLLILYAAYEILRDSLNQFIGKQPEKKQIEKVKSICDQVAGENTQAHHFHIHEYGDHCEMTFHINLAPAISLFDAHEIASKIEKRLKEEMDIVATIHMEPVKEE